MYKKIFPFGKSKLDFKNCQILKSFAHSKFRIARDFANSDIRPLIKINFDALTSEFLFPILVTRKFGCFTFERLLIFLIESLTFYNFAVRNFNPHPFLFLSLS